MRKDIKKTFVMMLAFLLTGQQAPLAKTNDQPKRWAIAAGFGQTSLDDATPDGEDFYLNDDLGNTFYVTGDYYLTQRLALTGGWYLESDGMMTDASDGIGYKHINLTGLEGGVKFYFFPKKWIVQPHVGALVQTNVLNLGKMKGYGDYVAEQAYPGSNFHMDWDVRCPALSLKPQIGVDIHLFSTLSLCFNADFRVGLGGHNRYNVNYLDGPMATQSCHHRNTWNRTNLSLGLKLDFPTQRISNKQWNNLLWFLWTWGESHAK